MGFKAMIHTLAVRDPLVHKICLGAWLISLQAKARNFPVTSIGSLLDEPFTGVVYLKSSGITTDFHSLKGKRIGYVGEFGKVRLTVKFGDRGSIGRVRRLNTLTRTVTRSKSTSSPATMA